MQNIQLRITSLERRQTPNPDGGTFEWVGSGQVMDREHWHATVALYGNGVRQTRDALLEGRPYLIPIAPEDLIELSIE